ncbi:MAG: nickel-dependent lactate racemase [Gemmatimonadetes bacterium]|nr:nickel-dependent lactate racemase [Gemmatimonadota bacterium]MBT7859737.1 nickel-dependent lactate racemase [Gemmatimonadota bacterium]
MPRLRFDYGHDGLEADLPDDTQVLSMQETPGLTQIQQRLDDALRQPIGGLPLAEIAQGKTSACVVISDITRPVPNALILPPILSTLEAAGIDREAITILIGTGLHRPNEGDELIQLVGETIASGYHVVNHFARDRDTLLHLGETSCGAPIWIDKIYVEADLKIATSLIEPHLMAGFSGGRKAICPGIMGVDTMRVLHGPELLSHPLASEGHIEGNPFHQQALEVARMAGVDFTLSVAMNDRREVTGIFAGDLEDAHAAGCQFVGEHAGAWLEEPAPIVVTSSAGFPLDLTFYQAVKGLTAVLPIVAEGGTILLVAQCSEGLGGPEFTDLLDQTAGIEDFEARLADPDFFVIDQWQLQELCKVLRKARVCLVSGDVSADDTRATKYVDVTDSLADGLAAARERHGLDAQVVAVPRGPYVLTRCRD